MSFDYTLEQSAKAQPILDHAENTKLSLVRTCMGIFSQFPWESAPASAWAGLINGHLPNFVNAAQRELSLIIGIDWIERWHSSFRYCYV